MLAWFTSIVSMSLTDYCLKEKLRDESKFISVVIDIMPQMLLIKLNFY